MILSCKNISKTYIGQAKSVITDISVDLPKSCFVSIMGRSGSGKSTLLKLWCGLLKADAGEISVSGYSMENMTEKQQSFFRSQVIGIVFQDSKLISDFNVEDNILAPIHIARKKVDRDYYEYLLRLTELEEHVKKMPSQLSGGQRQRAAIARACIARPKIIFADEPTGNLDSKSESQVMQLFSSINKELKISIVQVTHSETCAKISNQIIRIDDGRIVT